MQRREIRANRIAATAAENEARNRREEALYRLNRTLRAISNSNQAMLHARTEDELMGEVCRVIVRDCGHAMVWIGMAELDEARSVRPVANAGFEAGYLESLRVTWADTERGRGPTGTAVRTGQPAGCPNMLTDPAFAPWRSEARKRGYASSIALPLVAHGAASFPAAFGAITIYAREPESFPPAEVELLAGLANDLAFGLQSLRLRAAQVRVEEALRHSEEKFALAFANNPAAVALTRLEDGVFLDVNQTWEAINGYRREEVLGLSARLLPIWPDAEAAARFVAELRERSSICGWEQDFHKRSGETYTAELSAQVLTMRGEKVILSTLLDITERKKAEAEIRRLAEFPLQNPNPILRVDPAGILIYRNPASGVLFEDPQAGPGTRIPETWMNLVSDAFRSGKMTESDIEVGPRIFLFSVVPIAGEGFANIYARDVTMRHRTEIALRTSEELARSQAARIQAILDAAPVVIWVANDPECRTITGNRVAQQILRVPEGANMSKTGQEAAGLAHYQVCRNGAELAPAEMPIQQVAASGIGQDNVTMDIVFDDGTVRSLLGNVTPLTDTAGRPNGAIAAFLDITERKQLDSILESAIETAEQRANELDAVITAVAESVIVYDPAGRALRANPAAVRDLGFDPVRHNLTGLVRDLSTRHPDGRPIHPSQTPTGRALRGETVVGERLLLTNAAGRDLIIVASASPLRVGDQLVGAVITWHDVTEMERLMDEVQRRAVELDTVFAAIGDGVLIYDAANRIVRMNAAAEGMLGYSPEDLRLPLAERGTVFSFETPEGAAVDDPAMLPVPRALQGEIVSANVLRLRHNREGTYVWLSVSAAPLRTADGRIFGAVSSLTDITERMESETALRKARDDLEVRIRERTLSLEEANAKLEDEVRERLRAEQGLQQAVVYNRNLIEATLDPISTVNSDGKIGDVNSAFELITGRHRENLIGAEFADVFTDGEKARAGVQRVFREEQVRDYELEIQSRDGSKIPVLFNASVFRDEREQVAGIIAVARDITIRKRGEEQIRQNALRLEALAQVSQALSRAGLDPDALLNGMAESVSRWIGDAVVIAQVSEDGKTLIPNAGFHPDPEIRNAVEEALTAGDLPVTESLAGEVLKTGKPLLLNHPTREDLQRRLSPQFWGLIDRPGILSVAMVPLTQPDQPLRILALLRTSPGVPYSAEDLALLENIGDRATLGLTNAQLYAELENALANEKAAREELIRSEKFAAMGRMLGSVAHELNNPLQTIYNCLFLTEGEIPPNSPVHAYLAMANTETRRLESLVSQLRELYRPRGSRALDRLDLAEVLSEVRTLLEAQLTAKNVIWESSDDLIRTPINGLRDRLKQVFINLATNAAEAMQPKGGRLRVSLVRSADGREAGAVFSDTGPGIPEQDLGRLFEPFFTTKSSGLGLGLSICFEIAQEHGGRLTVTSPPGQGATFTLWLPILPTPEG